MELQKKPAPCDCRRTYCLCVFTTAVCLCLHWFTKAKQSVCWLVKNPLQTHWDYRWTNRTGHRRDGWMSGWRAKVACRMSTIFIYNLQLVEQQLRNLKCQGMVLNRFTHQNSNGSDGSLVLGKRGCRDHKNNGTQVLHAGKAIGSLFI